MFFSCPIDLADAVRPHAVAHVQQQRARAAGKVEHAVQLLPLAGLRLLAVERDDGGEDAGDLLRRVKLARLLARAGRELADQVFVGIAQRVGVGGELRQPLGDLGDDRAELGVAVRVVLPELVRAEVDLREQPWKVLWKDSFSMYLKPSCSVLSSSPFWVRARWAMLAQRCSA